jgi:hypothetical protein
MAQQIAATIQAPQLTDNGIDVGDDYQEMADLMRETHGAPLAETDSFILFRDGTGHELNEFVKDMDVTHSELSERMHELARTVYHDGNPGDEWSVTDPVVLAK